MRAHLGEIVQHGGDCAPFFMQCRSRCSRSSLVRSSIAANGSSSKSTSASCDQHPGKQRALELADREIGNCARREPVQPDSSDRFKDARCNIGRWVAESTKMPPGAERHERSYGHGKGSLQRTLLRQVSHPAVAEIVIASRRVRTTPASALSSVLLASAVRPDDRSHAAGGERSRDILQCDAAAIAHRQVFNLDSRFLELLMRAVRRVRIVAGIKTSDERRAAKLPKAEADKRETFLIWRAAAWARVAIGVPYLDPRRSRCSVISSLVGRTGVTKSAQDRQSQG